VACPNQACQPRAASRAQGRCISAHGGRFCLADRIAAIDDAKIQIDRFGPRWVARNDTSGIQLTTIA